MFYVVWWSVEVRDSIILSPNLDRTCNKTHISYKKTLHRFLPLKNTQKNTGCSSAKKNDPQSHANHLWPQEGQLLIDVIAKLEGIRFHLPFFEDVGPVFLSVSVGQLASWLKTGYRERTHACVPHFVSLKQLPNIQFDPFWRSNFGSRDPIILSEENWMPIGLRKSHIPNPPK